MIFEDQFEEFFLSRGQLERSIQLSTLVLRNVRAQFDYRPGARLRVECYKTRGGAEVPWILTYEGKELGLIINEGSEPTLSQTRSSDSFLRSSSGGKAVFLCLGAKVPRLLDSRSMIVPLGWVL